MPFFFFFASNSSPNNAILRAPFLGYGLARARQCCRAEPQSALTALGSVIRWFVCDFVGYMGMFVFNTKNRPSL